MSEQYPGGFISKTAPTVTTSSAQGMWTLSQQAGYQKQGVWPQVVIPDAQFNYVTMLLHGDGTNGAQNNTFLDSSTNNYTITRYGNTTQGSFSPYGSNWSNYFDGAASYLTVANNTALQFGTGDFTIECWVYLTSYAIDIAAAVCKRTAAASDGTWAIDFAAGTGTLRYRILNSTGGVVTVSIGTVSLNTWTHIAVSKQSGTTRTYLNGVAGGTTTNSTSIDGSTFNVRIATGDASADRYLLGNVSNLRFVKGTAIYTASFTPPTAPLTAVSGTSLLTCQSNRFIDNSSNAFAITITGTPSVQRFNPFGASTAYSTSVIGGSAYYDGTGDSLSTPAVSANIPDNADDYTVEAWIYLTSQGSVTTIYSGSTTGYFAWRNSGEFEFVSGALELRLTYTYPANRWCHVAVTRQSGTVRMFVDGALTSPTVVSGTVTGNTDVLITGTTYYFGSYTNSTSGPFYGYISNFRIVKGTAVYTAAFTPPTAPLTAITNTAILLNNTNGAIFDNAMMNDLETVGNAQISTSVKKYGTGSLAFDGTGDSLVANGVSISGAYNQLTASGVVNTVEFWLYVNSFTSPRAFLCGSWTASGGYAGWTYDVDTNGDIFISANGSGTTVSLSTKITTGNWQHIAFVNDGTNIKIYLNGTNVGTQAVASPSSYIGPLTIGMRSDSSLPLNGYIDDLRITKGYARYTTTFTPPTEAFPNTGPV